MMLFFLEGCYDATSTEGGGVFPFSFSPFGHAAPCAVEPVQPNGAINSWKTTLEQGTTAEEQQDDAGGGRGSVPKKHGV